MMTRKTSALAPRISVLMPVYNAASYLHQSLQSVLEQSFADFECLIIDDGSTDASVQILRHYARNDARIRFIARENRGVARTLNDLAAMARAPYLARMDADDICLPERFARQIAFLDAHPQVGALGGHVDYIDDTNRPIMKVTVPTNHKAIDHSNCKGHAALIHPAVMMRRETFEAVGGYDETVSYAEDLDLWLRLAEQCTLANLDALILKYRLTSDSVSAVHTDTQFDMSRKACEAAWARRGLKGMRFKETAWRPGSDRKSRHDFSLQWAWQAWGAGNRGTARFYFLKALKIMPWSAMAWKALITGNLKKAPLHS